MQMCPEHLVRGRDAVRGERVGHAWTFLVAAASPSRQDNGDAFADWPQIATAETWQEETHEC